MKKLHTIALQSNLKTIRNDFTIIAGFGAISIDIYVLFRVIETSIIIRDTLKEKYENYVR